MLLSGSGVHKYITYALYKQFEAAINDMYDQWRVRRGSNFQTNGFVNIEY
jgi:hypothetical protein